MSENSIHRSGESVYTWAVENFSMCLHQTGECLTSPIFTLDPLNSKWYLRLYPRGKTDNACTSIEVAQKGKYIQPNINHYCHLEYRNRKHELIKESAQNIRIPPKGIGVECVMMQRKEILKKIKPEDVLVIYCNLRAEEMLIKSLAEIYDQVDLTQDISSLYENAKFSDLTLQSGSTLFKVHKFLLYARWPKFLAELEEENSTVTFFDIETSKLQTIFKYIYSGKLKAELPLGFYTVSKKYELFDATKKMGTATVKWYARTHIKVDIKTIKCAVEHFNVRPNANLCNQAFNVEVSGCSEWMLNVWFTNISETEENFKIHICRSLSDKGRIYLKCEIYILHITNNATLYLKRYGHLFQDEAEWHLPSFINKNTLKELKNKYFFQDFFLLFVLHFSDDETNSFLEKTTRTYISKNLLDQRANDLNKFCCDLKMFYNNRKYTDVTLRTGDANFVAHKAVLSARSPVFCKMFEHEMMEKTSNNVEIPDIESEILDNLLRYIYCAEVKDLVSEKAMKLYEAADKYQVLTLKEKCSIFLKNNLKIENAAHILIVADMHVDGGLKNAAKYFIFRHADEILETKAWKDIMKGRNELENEILTYLVVRLLQEKKVNNPQISTESRNHT